MTNQAAQTMPLPEPEVLLHSPTHGHVYGYTTEQMRAYGDAREAAALSQTAGVPDVLFDGYAVYQGMTDEARARINAGGVSDVLDSVVRLIRAQAAPAASGGEVSALNLRGDETNQEVLAEFIRVCREVKPVGQWPGERVCRAIENLMSGPRDFISPDDRSPLRFGVGRGNEGGRLGLMGRELTKNQHDAAGDAKCIWPDCGHDTNQVGYSSGCTGVYCHNRADPPTKTDKQYADADALIAHLDGLYDDGGQGCEKWGPAQAAIHGIRIWIADALSLPNPPAAASLSERARELLAKAYRDGGYPRAAGTLEAGVIDSLDACALRAIEQALTQQRGEPNGKLVGWWNGIMPDVTERSPYGPSVRWGADAEDSAHDIPLYDGYNPIHYTTPQPSADAVRELVKRWRLKVREQFGYGPSGRALLSCADELESLLSGGSHA